MSVEILEALDVGARAVEVERHLVERAERLPVQALVDRL